MVEKHNKKRVPRHGRVARLELLKGLVAGSLHPWVTMVYKPPGRWQAVKECPTILARPMRHILFPSTVLGVNFKNNVLYVYTTFSSWTIIFCESLQTCCPNLT